MKKILSLFLSLLMIFLLTSCTQTLDGTINADGSVSVVAEILLTQDEYNQLISMGGGITTEQNAEISDVTIDGVEYKKITQSKKYNSISEFKKDALSSFSSEITTKELWFTCIDTGNSTEITASTVNMFFTMPYKITKTNGEQTSDYSVKFNSIELNKYYYLVTENSTSDWTQSSNIEEEIKKQIFNKTKVANFKFKPVLNTNLKSVKLTNTSGYMIFNGKNYFNNNAKLSYLEIYRKTNNGNYVKIGTKNLNKTPIKDTIYTDNTVKPNKKYTYKIRGVYKEGNLIKYSSYSSSKSITVKPNVPKLLSAKTPSKKTAKIVWKKISNVNGYQIYRSVRKNSGYKKIKTITKPYTKSFVNKKLKSKKTYYYKIRSYKVVSGKRVYSDFSAIKKVKVK